MSVLLGIRRLRYSNHAVKKTRKRAHVFVLDYLRVSLCSQKGNQGSFYLMSNHRQR
jgi:hypothetical protein